MALDWCAGQEEIDLVIVVAVSAEILDAAQDSLAVCDGDIHVVLLAMGVDGEALESEVAGW